MSETKKVKYTEQFAKNSFITRESTVEFQPDVYCMKCATKGVWEDQSHDDYYYGNTNICLNCNATFYLIPAGTITKYEVVGD